MKTSRLVVAALMLAFLGFASGSARAEAVIEKAGVGVGVTAGNMWFLPIKAITVAMGALTGALSYVVTGGNAELTQQIWQDTLREPYAITPDVARTAIGHRPELEHTK
jgi:hypothetical protein